jgi:hypothetical protein
MKTICAIMNADSSDLVIEVSDHRQALGLCLDYQTLRTPSRDSFENKLKSLFSAKVGDSFLRFMRVSFPIVNGVEMCRVKVYPSSESVFIKENGLEHCTRARETTVASSYYLIRQDMQRNAGARFTVSLSCAQSRSRASSS